MREQYLLSFVIISFFVTFVAVFSCAEETTPDPADPATPPTVGFANASLDVQENSGTATVPLAFDIPAEKDFTLAFSVLDSSTATSDDYSISGVTGGAGTIAVNDGDASVSISIAITDDSAFEQMETIVLQIDASSDSSYTTNDNNIITVNILDSSPTVSFASASLDVREDDGTATVSIAFDNPAESDFTLSFSVSGSSTATSDDYSISGVTSGAGTIAVNDGDAAKSIEITLSDDSAPELTETIVLQIDASSDSSYNIDANNTIAVNILDDDGGLLRIQAASDTGISDSDGITKADPIVMEGNTLNGNILLTLTDGTTTNEYNPTISPGGIDWTHSIAGLPEGEWTALATYMDADGDKTPIATTSLVVDRTLVRNLSGISTAGIIDQTKFTPPPVLGSPPDNPGRGFVFENTNAGTTLAVGDIIFIHVHFTEPIAEINVAPGATGEEALSPFTVSSGFRALTNYQKTGDGLSWRVDVDLQAGSASRLLTLEGQLTDVAGNILLLNAVSTSSVANEIIDIANSRIFPAGLTYP